MSEFPKRLWPYSAALAVAVAASVALLVRQNGAPAWLPLAVFGFSVVYCTHRKVALPTGAFVSPGFMICMTAIVVFRHQATPAGPVLVGVLSGIYLPGLNTRNAGWLVFNGAVTGLALLSATLVYGAFPASFADAMPVAALAALASALIYVCTAWALVVLSYVVEDGKPPKAILGELAPLSLQVLPFAVLGFFLGRLYLALGAAVLLLIIVPILIAREMFASYMRVKESHEETVGMLIRALEAKDRYTAGHAERVANYARYMGEELSFMPARLERLRFAALMHDIGKLVVPNQLLNKPGRLTPEEFAKVRIHEKVSVQMLSHIDFLRPIAGAAHSDNTKFDPDNEDHPIEPYIVMIADAYDAMTSTRSYRKALSQDVAFQELRDKAGIQFHPECVEALIHSIEARGEKHGAGFEEQDEFDDAPDAGLGSAGLGDLLPSDS